MCKKEKKTRKRCNKPQTNIKYQRKPIANVTLREKCALIIIHHKSATQFYFYDAFFDEKFTSKQFPYDKK